MQASSDRELLNSEQLERVGMNRPGLWWALALQLLGLLLFVLFCTFVVPRLGEELSDNGRIALGLALSLIPAILWLAVFYGFDRIEPEPKQNVIVTFVVALIFFAAVARPVLGGLFQIDAWLDNTWWSRVLGGILVVGVFEMYLIFLVVRYLPFEMAEFDERVDGVLYAVAAGLGVATAVNFSYVIDHGGVDLGIGSLRMVVNTLAYASFAGILGYFIGQAKFERTPAWYMPVGLLLAATLSGLLFATLERPANALQPGLPWGDLLLASFVAVASLLLVFWFVARANEETLRIARGEAAPTVPKVATQPVTSPAPAFAQPVAASDNPAKPEKGAPVEPASGE